MAIFASRGRVPRMLSVLSGGAAVVLLLGAAASPSSAGGARARAPVVAGVGATTSGGAWGQAKEVAAALNTGGFAYVQSVSCASAGNCTAGGSYNSSGFFQAFVVTETNGAWGQAKEVAAALNTRNDAGLKSVSCASAGNCTAGGFYTDSSGFSQAFVVTEAHGAWGKAQEVAGALNTGGWAHVDSVSCTSAGNCAAGGFYSVGSGFHGFVVTETHGAWGKPQQITGAGAVVSVSCASAGNCAAGGFYTDSSANSQAFVVTERHGIWGKAQEVAAALNTGGSAAVSSVSCGSAGNCSAAGSGSAAFVVDEANGIWGKAQEVAGALSVRGGAGLASVSCTVSGSCSAGGSYQDRSARTQAFVVSKP